MFQPVYADLGITAIPCSTDAKKPLVTNWQQMGIPASRQLAAKFTEANALGIVCGERNKITTLDVDSTDAGVLKEAMHRVGAEARVIAKTASGKYHGFYRFNGEKRRIKPWRDLPVDVLGGGFVMAVPSLFKTGEYHFVEGRFDDLKRLTIMGKVEVENSVERREMPLRSSDGRVKQGQRTKWMLRECMRAAHHCSSLEEVVNIARTRNGECDPPMEESEIMTTASSAWDYQLNNRNYVGSGQHGAYMRFEEATRLMTMPDTLALLVYLRTTQGPWSRFMIPNTLTEQFRWDIRRLRSARTMLIDLRHIRLIKAAHTGSPALYEWAD
jgi:hypothetical protein